MNNAKTNILTMFERILLLECSEIISLLSIRTRINRINPEIKIVKSKLNTQIINNSNESRK